VTAERTRAAQALATTESAQRAMAGEQAALRRVATLVAEEAAPDRVFEQVTEEVGRLLGLPTASVLHFDGPGRVRVVGSWSMDATPHFPAGATYPIDGETVVAKVLRTGRPQRVEGYDTADGTLAETMRSLGYRSAVAAPVHVGGRLWGVLASATASAEPLPDGIERRLCDFADLVAQALANADAYEKLAASRARLVEVGDAERRRLERNLHDGAQQRLVSVALQLGMVDARLERDAEGARAILATAREDLGRGLDELRELARGIHPVVLTERGLGPALEGLVTRAPVPVEIEEIPEGRLAPNVEAAAYYLVAEALTNVAKYGEASHATVSVRATDGTGGATVTVSDDGVGGADPTRGSGLRGLAARIEALNGRLEVDSPPGGGTRIAAAIPGPDA
jgi:signal transduction histidine kinase